MRRREVARTVAQEEREIVAEVRVADHQVLMAVLIEVADHDALRDVHA
jgi:hypothetical protein